MRISWLAWMVVALASACSDATMVTDDFVRPDFAQEPGLDAGASLDGPRFDGSVTNDDGGPTIVVTDPLPNPAAPPEVQYDTLTVTAQITSTVPISVDTIKLTTPVGSSVTMSLVGVDTYRGSIDISAIPSGATVFSVTAADINKLQSGKIVDYIHDHGPTITFTSPTASTVKGAMNVQMIINDPLHPIDVVTLMAGIRAPNDITNLMNMPSGTSVVSTATVNLNAYTPILDGPQLLRAQVANMKGTIGRATKPFTVDNTGPSITLVAPKAGEFVGGILTINADVDDPAGVNESTVFAVFGGNLTDAVALSRVMSGQPRFSGVFDVRSLGRSFVSPTLSIRADDTLGNHSEKAIEIIVDNTPPQISLDPPLLRVSKKGATGGRECSQTFDPVGAESANDGAIVQQMITLKARIGDHGNIAPGLLVERISGIDANTVVLWLTPAASGAILAVDSDGDGVCDDINPLMTPTGSVNGSNQAVTVALTPMAPGGLPDYRPTTPVPPGWAFACDAIGDPLVLTPPDSICPLSGTAITYVITSADPVPSAIWTIPPVGTGADCIGLQFDSLNRMPEGPACVVVRGVDKAGNQMVSPPLRVCINRGGGQCVGFNAGTAPACTGTFNRATNTVSATPCVPATMFPANEVIPLD